jgi:hypothetical protein
MLKLILTVSLTLAISLGGGIWSAELATREFHGFGTMTIGGWEAQPRAATAEADAYSRAYTARSGTFVRGSAEGLTLYRSTDDAGDPLVGHCRYEIDGRVRPAHEWTLDIGGSADGTDGRDTLVSLTNSQLTNYRPDGSFAITLDQTIAPGNWVRPATRSPFTLFLTLYDTAIASNTGLNTPVLPAVRKVACDAD